MNLDQVIAQLTKLSEAGHGEDIVYTNNPDDGYVEVEDIVYTDMKWMGRIAGIIIK